MNAVVIICELIIVIPGIVLNYKRYQENKMTKRAFVTNFVGVFLLLVVGSLLITLK